MSPATPPTGGIDLSVVVACYNEAPHLAASVGEILAVLERSPWSSEIIFVEDCSTDDTRAVLERVVREQGQRVPMRVILHQRNQGRGATVSDGLRAARGRYAGFLDIDLEVHARYIPSMVRALEEGAHLALAERVYHVRLTPGFLLRHLLSRGYRRLSNQWLGLDHLDTEAGYKFFDLERILPVLDECRDPGWFWDTEIVALAHYRGLRIATVPCLFLRRTDKQSTLKVLPATIDYLGKLRAFRRRLAGMPGRGPG